MSDIQEIAQPNNVCYTEDSANWPEFVTTAYQEFGFQVSHFTDNSAAWTDIQQDNKYDVFVLDNDTGPMSINGVELIENVLSLPRKPGRELVVIILSSSNLGALIDKRARSLRDQYGVDLCYKPDSWCLQAEYARYKIDGNATASFETWLYEIKGIDLSQRDGDDKMKEANASLYRDLISNKRQREGGLRRKEGE